MLRSILTTTLGFLAAFVIAISGAMIFIAILVKGNRTEWDILNDSHVPQRWIEISILMGFNGGIGAFYGLKTGSRRSWPVSVFPLVLVMLPCIAFIQDSTYSEYAIPSFILVCSMALFLALFMWIAGRVGQVIGIRLKVSD